MIIYVLTNNKRVLDNSYKQIVYNLYVDKNNEPHACYLNLLNLARKQKEDVLVLEDDLMLCKGFLERIEPIIEQYKDYIINFFWQPLRNIKNTTIETKGFCYTQCVYYPEGMINKFYKDLQKPTFSYARNIKQALEKNGIPFVQVRPHYVQHIGDESLIWQGLCVRRSNMFIDDLESK
jgi:GR25 family glycosyltransferase involved in LPS biosynthesis